MPFFLIIGCLLRSSFELDFSQANSRHFLQNDEKKMAVFDSIFLRREMGTGEICKYTIYPWELLINSCVEVCVYQD